MRNNSRLYLYIGVGAIAIVLLSAVITAMFNRDNTGTKEEAQEIRQEEDVVKDRTSRDRYEEVPDSDVYDVVPDGSTPERPIVGPDNLTGEAEVEDEWDDEEEIVDAATNTYTFNEGSILEWPVSGNIIMNYSMDKMIYFATLDAYKYHPAICIQAEEGTPVVAAATGQVVSVTEEADTGLTVGMRIGSEHVIYYGQLKECDLVEGDHVNRGETFAKVSAPTKHYLMEGPHLYVRLERKEEPVNPMSYLDFSE